MKPENELTHKRANHQKPNFERLYGVLFIFLMGLIILNSSIFNVKAVYIRGNQTLSTADILRNTNLNLSRNIFQIDCNQLRQIIMHNPKIAAAKVFYQFPDKIVIRIRERRPLCLLLFADNLLIIGEDAVVIDLKDENEPIKLPVITGIDLNKIEIGEAIKDQHFNAALAILRLADENLRIILSEIDIKNYVMYIDLPNSHHTLKVELGNAAQLEEKISKDLRSILSRTAPDELSTIDLRIPSFPTVIKNTAQQ